jgi:type II secretory pathway pseudopilin PulG
MRIQPTGASGGRRGGFTLIEILTAVVIIILLVGILIPTLSRVHLGANKAAASAELGSLQAGLQGYFADFNMYPPSAPAYGGLPSKRGGAMLAQGLMGYLDFGADGAGPSNPAGPDPKLGFRTRRNATMGGGQIYGPYASAGADVYKINSATDQFFIDPWGHEILYYCSTRASAPTQIFANSGFFYFNSDDCSTTAAPPSSPNVFFTLINGNNTNTPTVAVTGSSSYLLISAGNDEKYFTADDIVAGK